MLVDDDDVNVESYVLARLLEVCDRQWEAARAVLRDIVERGAGNVWEGDDLAAAEDLVVRLHRAGLSGRVVRR